MANLNVVAGAGDEDKNSKTGLKGVLQKGTSNILSLMVSTYESSIKGLANLTDYSLKNSKQFYDALRERDNTAGDVQSNPNSNLDNHARDVYLEEYKKDGERRFHVIQENQKFNRHAMYLVTVSGLIICCKILDIGASIIKDQKNN